jgi:glycosyltransferase involved in cell wall biosynthesis
MVGIGGSERYLEGILPALREKGVDCTFLNVFYPKNRNFALGFSENLREKNVPVIDFEIKAITQPTLYWKLSKIYQKGNYDIVHTHLIHSNFIWAIVKLLFHKKMCLVSTKHGYLTSYIEKYGINPNKGKKDSYWWACFLAEKMMNRSFAVSESTKLIFVKKGLCQADKMDVIPHGISPSKEPEYVPEFRLGNPQLIIVGRLHNLKGHHYAFQAVKKLLPQFSNLKLVVVGKDGGNEQSIRKEVENLNIQRAVEFVGFSDRALDYMHTSDIVLLPSSGETFGLVILEAMVAQRPVVAFDVPAPNDIIEHKQTGLLAKPMDGEDFTEQVLRLLEDENKREKIAEEAMEKTLKRFSFEQMVENTVGFYEKVFTNC